MRNLSNAEKIGIAVIITFIALIVTSSIVITAWMNSVTLGPMEMKELTVTDMVFTEGNATEGKIVVNVINTCTLDVTVDTIKVDGTTVTTWTTSTSATVESGSTETFTITCEITTGNEYSVTMFATDELIAAYKDTA